MILQSVKQNFKEIYVLDEDCIISINLKSQIMRKTYNKIVDNDYF